jgi:hypothetical protein
MAVTFRFGTGVAEVASVAIARAPAKATMIVENDLVRNRPRMFVSPFWRPRTGAIVRRDLPRVKLRAASLQES